MVFIYAEILINNTYYYMIFPATLTFGISIIREITKDQILISFLFNIGQRASKKKTIKKTIPKFLFVGSFILFFMADSIYFNFNYVN